MPQPTKSTAAGLSGHVASYSALMSSAARLAASEIVKLTGRISGEGIKNLRSSAIVVQKISMGRGRDGQRRRTTKIRRAGDYDAYQAEIIDAPSAARNRNLGRQRAEPGLCSPSPRTAAALAIRPLPAFRLPPRHARLSGIEVGLARSPQRAVVPAHGEFEARRGGESFQPQQLTLDRAYGERARQFGIVELHRLTP